MELRVRKLLKIKLLTYLLSVVLALLMFDRIALGAETERVSIGPNDTEANEASFNPFNQFRWSLCSF